MTLTQTLILCHQCQQALSAMALKTICMRCSSLLLILHHTKGYVMLCYVMLCYVMLCYVMLGDMNMLAVTGATDLGSSHRWQWQTAMAMWWLDACPHTTQPGHLASNWLSNMSEQDNYHVHWPISNCLFPQSPTF